MLRRERKQRVEAAEAYRAAGQEERAAAEEADIPVIDEYLPAAMTEAELAALVDAAIAETGADDDARHGPRDGPGHGARRGPGRRPRGLRARAQPPVGVGFVSNGTTQTVGRARPRDGARRRPRRGADGAGRAHRRERLSAGQRADAGGRGGARSSRAKAMVDELSELVVAGHRDRPPDGGGGGRRADRRRPRHGRAARRRLAAPRPDGGAQDDRPEALRRCHPRQHRHVRDRPGRHRQDLPGDRAGRRRPDRARGGADHPHPAGRRGGRAAGLPARRPAGQGRPLPAAAVRRPARHARRRPAGLVHGQGHGRGGAAGVHARPHPERLVHHPRRGPEHQPRADADVPHPAGLRLQGGRHRRHHADRPAPRAALGPGARDAGAGRRARHLVHPLLGRRRGAPQARAADRERLQEARRRHRPGARASDALGRDREPQRLADR